MHEPDLCLPYIYRSTRAAGVIDWNDRHLCTQTESPHCISAMNLQCPTVLLGNQIYQVQWSRTHSSASALAVFGSHVNATTHTLKLAPPNQLGYCFGDGRTRTKLCEVSDAERSSFSQPLNPLHNELRYRRFRQIAGHCYRSYSSDEQSSGWWKAITRRRYSSSSASFTRHSSRRPSEKI